MIKILLFRVSRTLGTLAAVKRVVALLPRGGLGIGETVPYSFVKVLLEKRWGSVPMPKGTGQKAFSA